MLVIGPSGAGKSWLASRIGSGLGLPVVHLDREYWGPGWTAPEPVAWRSRVAGMAAGNAWVMDGGYPSSMDLRLPRAQLVIWLDLPRHVYFPQALARTVRFYGRVRPDIGPGNPERLDPAFFRDWVWTYPARRAQDSKLMAGLPGCTRGLTLRTRRQMRQLVAGLPDSLTHDSVSK
jgi:adenylate kinase family enzyme